jgi:PAS domain S-box-containing protein
VSVTPLFDEDGQCQHLIGTVHDISEQKRAEEQLRLVADHAPGMIAYVDRNLVYGFNNAAYTQWLGIPAPELAGRSVARVLRSDVFDHCLPYMKRALHGESVRFEAKSLHQELGLRDTEVTYIPDQAPNGPVRGFYVFIHDITERKQEAHTLREAHERFQLAAAHEALTLYEQDIHLRYTWFFPLTPPRERSLGKTDQELLPNEDGELLTAFKKEVLQTGVSQRREVKITSFWPEPRYFDLIISPKRNETGQIIGIAGAALDITDLKRAEGNSSTS